MTRTGISGKRLYLVATTCASCGTVVVRWNGAVIKTVNLYSATTKHERVIGLDTFTSPKSGTLSVAVTSPTGKYAIIEGLAVNRT
jgi:hypothetical protein